MAWAGNSEGDVRSINIYYGGGGGRWGKSIKVQVSDVDPDGLYPVPQNLINTNPDPGQ